MAKLGEMHVVGKSGTKYLFNVYTRDTTFKAIGSVYLLSKRVPKAQGGGDHNYIYVGETGDLSDRPLNHHKKECFDEHGANCVSIRAEEDGDRRLKIESDILAAHHFPCND